MKVAKPAVVALAVICSGAAFAQSGGASGKGAVSGDPAASSATPSTSPTTGSTMKPTRSGSGTSTSGGSDANGDHGLDKMPDSDKSVMPLDQQHKPDNGK
jgi:streptogramin lyase